MRPRRNTTPRSHSLSTYSEFQNQIKPINNAIISPYNEKSISVLLSNKATEIPDLDLELAHRTLLLPWTQRICHQSGPQRGGSGGQVLINGVIGMWESGP